MHEILLKLGLSDKEASVYLAALELGEDTAQNIAEKSGVNRATTYVILEKLIQLGLASTVERGKKTVFIAEDPRELNNILNQQRQEIEQRSQLLEDSLTQLRAIYNANNQKPTVRFFEGPDGLEALDRYGHDQFQENMEFMSIMPVDRVEDMFPDRRKKAISDRVQLGIKSRVIYTHRNGAVLNEPINHSELRTAKYMPKDVFPITGSILIYPGWGVKFFNFEQGNLIGVLIQSPSVAHNLQELFELAWSNKTIDQYNTR